MKDMTMKKRIEEYPRENMLYGYKEEEKKYGRFSMQSHDVCVCV